MIKKVAIFILMIIIFSATISLAYSGDKYEIQITDSFSSEINNYMENYWGDDEGNSINVQISEIKSANEFQYSEDFLNALTEEIKNNIWKYKAEIKEQLIQQYEAGFSELNVSREEIEEVVNPIVENVEYKEFLVKEVTKFTKNNYPCLHYISNLSLGEESVYTETYQLVSDKTAYTLTISSSDPSFFEKQEIKDMVNSFTIKDYKEYAFTKKKSIFNSPIIYYVIVGLVGGTISALSKFIYEKASKKKNNKEEK